MTVLLFAPRASRQSKMIEVLKEMIAEVESGELEGFGACRRRRNGEENIVLAGYYDANPDEALRACLDASIILNRLNDEAQARSAASGP
jgi:hypothetical protein